MTWQRRRVELGKKWGGNGNKTSTSQVRGTNPPSVEKCPQSFLRRRTVDDLKSRKMGQDDQTAAGEHGFNCRDLAPIYGNFLDNLGPKNMAERP